MMKTIHAELKHSMFNWKWLAAPLTMLVITVARLNAQVVNLADLPVKPNRESNNVKVAPDKEENPSLFINKTPDGKPLTIEDKPYSTGLVAIHGSQSWSYTLNGEYSGLVMDLGQEGLGAGAPMVRVLGDGTLLYDSGQLPVKDHVTALVDVRGVKELQFAVIDSDGIPWNDRIVIGNPVLLKRPLPDAVDAKGKGGTPPPQAKIVLMPADGVAPLEVGFTGDQSKAPAGQVGRYTWYFGDGTTQMPAPNPKHTYTAPGLYEVLLQVEDDKGGVGVARQLVRVRTGENQPPIAMAKPSARLVKKGEAVQFDASDSFSADGAITSYQWDFGDGTKGEGKMTTHIYAAVGRFPAVITVQNKGGKAAKQAIAIKVTGPGEPPVFPLQKDARVLIIGNSLSQFCGPIDEWLKTFDKLSAHPLGLEFQWSGKGMGKLVEYATWSRLGMHDKINEGWDVVIIQPWIDAVDPNVSDEQLLKDCKTLVDWSKQAGAFPVLYEPQFGWQNLASDQARGHERIARLAEKLDAGLIPAGQAWLRVAKDFPMKLPGPGRSSKETDPETLDGLMYNDSGHQNVNGALFNSLMVWKYLTGQSPTDMKLSPTEPEVREESRRLVVWAKLPYLEKVADESIVAASQRVR